MCADTKVCIYSYPSSSKGHFLSQPALTHSLNADHWLSVGTLTTGSAGQWLWAISNLAVTVSDSLFLVIGQNGRWTFVRILPLVMVICLVDFCPDITCSGGHLSGGLLSRYYL